MASPDLEHIVAKTLHARRLNEPGPLSTGEALAAALVLNRADWLADMNYTIVEAIERVGSAWVALLPEAARIVEDTPR